jgi:hypothetical protein
VREAAWGATAASKAAAAAWEDAVGLEVECRVKRVAQAEVGTPEVEWPVQAAPVNGISASAAS